jgi:prepilin-type N-terminal cleavage/methylation domain-containing protein
MKNNKGFTLIELLVVVLIIGILAAIAVPKYQIAVEKSIMQEAILNLKAIAQANDRFFLANNRYADAEEISKLDITIPGDTIDNNTIFRSRIKTKHFLYAPDCIFNNQSCKVKAYAQRLPENKQYALRIERNNDLRCTSFSEITSARQKLCNQINQEGHL